MPGLTDLFSKSNLISAAKREVIIEADDEPQGVYYLAKGFVKMNSVLSDGREITVNIFKPGTYFPMMWAISNIPNSYYFQAMTPVQLYKVPQKTFSAFLATNPGILADFTNRILIGLNGLLFSVTHILSGDAYHRTISAVLMLARRFGETTQNGQIVITLPVTHQDLADIAAITRETASINVKLLENNGLIIQNSHKLIIPNLHQLESEADVTNQDSLSLPSL